MSDYPTDAQLDQIAAWPVADPSGWFAFIKSCWWAADWGWTEEAGVDEDGRRVYEYRVSTGGWSGNEEIVGAMLRNFILWAMTWRVSRRGGHYTFAVIPPAPEEVDG